MLFNTETSISVEMHGNYNNVLKDQSERAVWPLAGSMADKRWLLTLREKGWSIMRAAWGQDGKGVIKCKKNLKQVKVFLCQTVKKKQKQGHVSEVNKDTSKRCWWVTAQDVHTVEKMQYLALNIWKVTQVGVLSQEHFLCSDYVALLYVFFTVLAKWIIPFCYPATIIKKKTDISLLISWTRILFLVGGRQCFIIS